MNEYLHCTLCPRRCGADRTRGKGRCGVGDRLLCARAAKHFWEEPCISGIGENAPGSGTVFFSGCSLGCCFCQNHDISKGSLGKQITTERLAQIFLELQAKGAANINLVTPDHFLPDVLDALRRDKGLLHIPVACNCSGYETPEAVDRMAEEVDIFMPDLKFCDPALSAAVAGAPDYFEVALPAVCRMIRHMGAPVFDANGLLQRGVIVRHLVLPGHVEDSFRLLRRLAEAAGTDGYILSLMSQYTPYFDCGHKELNRRLSTYEYRRVTEEADRIGFSAVYTQQRSAAKEEYTPPFNGEGV